jgi:HemY protein
MNLFWRLLALLALAGLGALAWHALSSDPGYVLVTLRGWSVETTLVVAIAALLLAWFALRVTVWALRLPFRAWQRHARKVARERLAGGLVALHEGRWARAETLLTRAASDPTHRLPALLSALRAAEARGDGDSARALRGRLCEREDAPELAIFDAELRLAAGDPAAALAALDAVGIAAGSPPRAIELRMRALVEVGRAHEALALLPALRQSQLLEGAALDAFEAGIGAAALRQAPDADQLARRWEGASRSQRAHPEVVAAYAERAAALGLEDQGANAVEHALKKHWSESLARLYGHLPRGRRSSPLKAAEAWLKGQPNSPSLLLALGRLCREESLWGKAEDYLHRALAQGAGPEAWEELGHAYAAQGDDARARHAYANALRLARGEATLPMPGRGLRELIQDEAVAEERSAMGVPRLPGPG